MILGPGARLGPYRIDALVGAGGMGEVYKAADTRLGRTVAIKVATGQLPERLEREARAIAALNHPNICQIYDVGPDYLVMEFVEGTPVGTAGSVAELLDWALQIAGALVAAHEAGVVHRDLKPANVLITVGGRIKLLDFGLARTRVDPPADTDHTRTALLTLTVPGTTMGTLAYMSPEQARGEALDPRTDLWSFGVMLYEMATGVRPFEGGTAATTIDAVLNRDPIPVRDRNPKVPEAFERIVTRLLDKDRDTRYQSAADVRADLLRLERGSGSTATAAAAARRTGTRTVAIAAAGLAVIAGGIWFATRPAPPVTSVSEYVQLTDFNDSASAPSLSPDGRMLTFIRGGGPFLSLGQIYVKLLPNGESRQLTDSVWRKYGPAFTPDGSRIAYTLVQPSGSWDTWTVPVLGGQPTRLLPNASGLTWMSDGRVLFSEIKSGLHMGIVSATENRGAERDIYFPSHERAMAHFSYASPDGRSMLVVEMDRQQAWQRCRLAPLDGSSMGIPVGPDGECTAAAWSPDGRWMYLAVRVNGQSHLWRQRSATAAPQQITFGPTDEEGVAVSPDGRSLITSVGTQQASIWIHDASGERPVSPEGFATNPWLSPDGNRVYYLLRQNPRAVDFDICMTDLVSGRTDRVLTGMPVIDFDISRDERQVAFSVQRNGESQIWLAAADRQSAPRQVATAGDSVSFAADGLLVFQHFGDHVNHIYRMKQDGSDARPIIETPILQKLGVSPDGRFVTASMPGGPGGGTTVAVPLDGGPPRTVCTGRCSIRWAPDGRYVYIGGVEISNTPGERWRTFAVPLPPGRLLPDQPAAVLSPTEIKSAVTDSVNIALNGVLVPSSDPSRYIVARADLRRNLFRIPLH